MEIAKEKVEPIVVPVHDLPEFVTVETVCITPQYARENNIENVTTISKDIMDFMEKVKGAASSAPVNVPVNATPNAIPNAPLNATPTAPLNAITNGHTTTPLPATTKNKVKLVEQGTMTMGFHKYETTRVPNRKRGVQTEGPLTADMGIQCDENDLDESFVEMMPEKPSKEDSNESINREMEFLSFVNQHTEKICNGMLECRICGEISKLMPAHKRHMTLHFGPSALCYKCGTVVEHEHMLAQHGYNCPARYRSRALPRWHVQCPHLHCNFVVESKEQLAQHLKKHMGAKVYYCLECQKSFTSSTHFLVHRLMEKECREAKHIYLAGNSRESERAPIQRCTVCMRRFINAERCESHKRRCIRKHYKRQEKLLMSL